MKEKKCKMWESCPSRTAVCAVMEPDDGCPFYRYFKELLGKKKESKKEKATCSTSSEKEVEIHFANGDIKTIPDVLLTIVDTTSIDDKRNLHSAPSRHISIITKDALVTVPSFNILYLVEKPYRKKEELKGEMEKPGFDKAMLLRNLKFLRQGSGNSKL